MITTEELVTDEMIEAARVAHAELVQKQKMQEMQKRQAEREAKLQATHTLEFERDGAGTYRAEYRVEGFRVHVLASRGWDTDGRKKARVYADGEPEVDFTEAYEMQRANAEAHGSSWYEKGTFPEEDKLFARLNREVIKGKRGVLAEAAEQSADLAELLRGVKLNFSRTAGCSCGCSPAFIASSRIRVDHDGAPLNVTSIFVTKEVAK